MKYRLIIHGNDIYKETTLNDEFSGSLTIGTDKACQIAFKREKFISGFVVRIDRREDGQYMISCSETIYLQKDSGLREYVRPLQAGDHVSLNYNATDVEFMMVDFLPIFDTKGEDFDQAINVNGLNEFSIGGQVGCTIRIDDPNLVGDMVVLRRIQDGSQSGYQFDLSEAGLGVEINGFPSGSEIGLIKYGEFLSIRGYVFCIENNAIYITREAKLLTNLKIDYIKYQNNHYKYPKFIKNVRQLFKMPDETPEVLAPKNKPEEDDQSFLLRVAPMLVSMLLMVGLRGIMGGGGVFVIYFAATMTMSTIVTIINYVRDKKKKAEKEEKRRATYMEYLSKREDEIIRLREREQKVANYMNPKLSDYMQYIKDFDSRLFEKKREHEDYLKVRIGEGVVKSNCQVDFKKEDYVDSDDDLKDFPEAIHDKYTYVSSMPVCLDLKDVNAVGFVGNRTKLYQMEKNLIIEFAASHFYNDVKLFLVMDEEDVSLFSWARWLKVTYNEHTQMRNFMYDRESAKITLEFLYSELSRRESMGGVPEGYPDYVVLVFRSNLISNHPVSKYIERANELGFRFVFFEEYPEFTNEFCAETIYLNDTDNTGYIQKADDGENIQTFVYEHVSKTEVEAAAKKLSSVYVDEVNLENTLTKNITLYELLNIMSPYDLNLRERWAKSRIYDTMAAPLGVKSGNEIVCLDLHEKYHGPHGLVAGTTGSGKSEILQSYILSMATLFHPYEVGFIIIDFKGGGMVNQFRQLPHLNGAITNIDGNEVERSLLSIKAELYKRQELFAEQDVNHIDDYIRAYKEGRAKTPLPHLILIVDEFAELKSEQPEFMKELISAARIGRSLGVHLILATQKPSGVVSDQIWSNSKFKLCLKVQNKTDSNEVLKSPLAAEIREPGRAYLQVGNNEIFQLFQSAYSGAPSKTDGISDQKKFRITAVELSGQRKIIYEQKPDNSESGETQLRAIVNYIKEYCDQNGIEKLPNICMPSLSESIPVTMDGFYYDGTDVVVPIGITDDPSRQNQYVEVFDPSQENFFILGSSQYGKTNLIQTIIRGLAENYSPRDVNIYILDFASMILRNFENLNHVGGVITSSDEERLKGFIKLMYETIQYRKKYLAQRGLSSFSAYRESGQSDIPQIVVFLDNWIAFRSYFSEYEDSIIEICRDSVAVGISFVVTAGQGSGVGFKLLANFAKRTALYCNDSSDYNVVFDSCRKKLTGIPGRALIQKEKAYYECQYYLAFAAEKEYEKINLMKDFLKHISEKYKDQYVSGIAEIPDKVTENFIIKQFGNKFAPYEIPLGMEYESVERRTIKLDKVFVHAFYESPEGKYKNTYINYLINRVNANKQNEPAEIYIADGLEGEYKGLQSVVDGYVTDVDGLTGIMKSIEERLKEREEKMRNADFDISKEPLLLVIVNSLNLIKSFGTEKELIEIYKTISDKYKAYKICFLLTDVDNALISFKDGDLLKYIKNNKGVVVFEEIAGIKIVDVPLSATRKYKKQLDAFDAYYFVGEKLEKIKVVES